MELVLHWTLDLLNWTLPEYVGEDLPGEVSRNKAMKSNG